MKSSITNLFNKCDQIHRKLRISSQLRKKYVMEISILCSGIDGVDGLDSISNLLLLTASKCKEQRKFVEIYSRTLIYFLNTDLITSNNVQKIEVFHYGFLQQMFKKLKMWSHLRKKSLMENFIFSAIVEHGFRTSDFRSQTCLKKVT